VAPAGVPPYLNPQLDALLDDDPDKRWVLAKCEWGIQTAADACQHPGWPWHDPYRDRDAEAYARRG